MKAILKGLHSPDVPQFDLERYVPEDPRCFGLLIQAFFGPDDAAGDESFDMLVCTPRWLEEKIVDRGEIILGRHYLIVDRYDFARIKTFLANYGEQCSGAPWNEVAEEVGRIGKWEFEDYRSGIDNPSAPSGL